MRIFLTLSLLSLPLIASAEEAVRCSLAGAERTISIHRSGEASVPCEVRYQKGEGSSIVLWEAHNEVGYCEARAAEFVEQQRTWGWTCEEHHAPESS